MMLQWPSILLGIVLALLVMGGLGFLLNFRRIPYFSQFALRPWTQKKIHLPQTLTDIMHSPASVEEIAEHVLTYLDQQFAAQRSSVVVFNEDTGYAELVAVKQLSGLALDPLPRMRLSSWLQLPPFKSGEIVTIDVQNRAQGPHHLSSFFTSLQRAGVRTLHFVPLRSQTEPIGSLNIGLAEKRTLTVEEQMMLYEVAQLLTLTIQQASFVEQERRQREFAETMFEIGQALNKTLNQEELLSLILQELSKIVAYDSASIFLLENGNDMLRNVAFKTIHTATKRSLRLLQVAEYQHIQEVFDTRQPVIIANTAEDPRWQELETTRSVHSWMGVPLIADEGVIGLLNLTKREPDYYHERDCQVTRIFAAHAVTAIGNVRLYEAERRARLTSESLRTANVAIMSSMNLEMILGHILDHLGEIVDYDAATVLKIDSDEQIVVHATRVRHESFDKTALTSQRFSLSQHENFRQICETKTGFIIPDTKKYASWEHRFYAPIRSWIGIPLLEHNRVIGFLTIDKREPFFYSEEDLHAAELLAAQASMAFQNARLLQETQTSVANLQASGHILELLNSAPAVQAVLPDVVASMRGAIGFSAAFFVLLAEPESYLGRLLAYGDVLFDSDKYLDLATAVPPTLLADKKIYVNQDLASSSLPFEEKLAASEYKLHYFLPLNVRSELLGGVSLVWQTMPDVMPDQLLLTQMSRSIAMALERTQLFDAVHHRAQQLALLNRLGAQISGILDTRTLCRTVAQHLCVAFQYQTVSIYLMDAATAAFSLVEQYDTNERWAAVEEEAIPPADKTLLETTVRTRKLQESASAAGERSQEPARLALPLQSQGEIIGVMTIVQAMHSRFKEDEKAILSIAADQLAVAIDKARLLRETEQQKSELETLYGISTALRLAEQSDDIILATLQHVTSMMHILAIRISVASAPADAEASTFSQHYQAPPDFAWRVPVSVAEEAIANLQANGRWHLISTATETTVLPPEMGDLLYLPLQAQNEMMGVMAVALPPQPSLSAQERQLLTAVAEIVASALDRAFVHETLEERVALRTQELETANQKLLELDRLKSKFVADVSHELRTPITNLKLYLDIFANAAPAKQEKYLHVLHGQTERLASLVEDILALSNLASEQARARAELVDLNAVVETAVAPLQALMSEKRIQLQLNLSPELPSVTGILSHLQRAISNLLHNAVEHTEDGLIILRTRYAAETGNIYLQIEDTGNGIAAEDLPHVFDRFYRGHSVSQLSAPGTGLGLAIVKEILEMHHGGITVESDGENGALFELWLPEKDAAPDIDLEQA